MLNPAVQFWILFHYPETLHPTPLFSCMILLWLAVLDKRNTRDFPSRRQITDESALCSLCSSKHEKIVHLLLPCNYAWATLV